MVARAIVRSPAISFHDYILRPLVNDPRWVCQRGYPQLDGEVQFRFNRKGAAALAGRATAAPYTTLPDPFALTRVPVTVYATRHQLGASSQGWPK